MKSILSYAEKHLIRKLHESEYFIQQIVSCTPDIFYVLDLDKNKFTFTSKRAEQVMGLDNIMMDKIHPFDYTPRQRHISDCRSLRKSETKDIDIRMRVKCGKWNWFNVRDTAFTFDEYGNATHTMGIVRNVHEEKTREQLLVHDQQILKGLINSSNLGIVIYKPVRNHQDDIIDFEFVLASRAFEELHGKKNLVGKWLFEEFPETRQTMCGLFNKIVESEAPFQSEASYLNAVSNKMHLFTLKYEKFGDGFMISWEDNTHASQTPLLLTNNSVETHAKSA